MDNLQRILTEIVKENKKDIMIIIRDEKENIIASSNKINIKEMCRYPSEEYYEYKSKIWRLKELMLMYNSKPVTVQMYINITNEIMERKSLKKDRQSGLINKEYLEEVLNKLVKKIKTTSKGVTVILFEFDDEQTNKYSNETITALIKDLGDSIVGNITSNDYGFRLDKNSFLVLLDNYSSGKNASLKAEIIETVVESKAYPTKIKSRREEKPIVYYGVGTIGTTKIPGNDPMSIIRLAKDNLENQKEQKRESRKFLEEPVDDVVLS